MDPRITVFSEGVVDPELTGMARDISDRVQGEFGLNYWDINFYVVPLDTLASLMATGGTFAHPQSWRLGQTYWIQKLGHSFGNWIVYELVNCGGNWERREPMEAFLYDTNTSTDMKLVMAHVYGHAHVRAHNWKQQELFPFSLQTKMKEQQELTDEYERRYGERAVEGLADIADAMSTLADWYPVPKRDDKEDDVQSYLGDLFVPGRSRNKLFEEVGKRGKKPELPEERRYDVLQYVAENSPALADWERDILKMTAARIRGSGSIGLTRILNEGFATTVDYRFATETGALTMGEAWDYLNHRARGLWPSRTEIQPYFLGSKMLAHVREMFDKGRFGSAFEKTKDAYARRTYDAGTKRGWDAVLEAVAGHTDNTFIDQFFTPEVHDELKHVLLAYEGDLPANMKVLGRDFQTVKDALLFDTYNGGLPRIAVEKGGGPAANGELLLVHDVSPYDHLSFAPKRYMLSDAKLRKVLPAVYQCWKHPVSVQTIDNEGKSVSVRYDGKDFSRK